MNQNLQDPFKFNLIPAKGQAEIKVIVERDDSLFYAFILIFIGMLIFFILTLIHVLVVTPRMATLDASIANRTEAIKSFDPIRKINGELIVKSQALEPILELDIKISELLTISESLAEKVPGSRVLNYSRESGGVFIVNFTIPSYISAAELIEAAKNQPRVLSPYIRGLSRPVGSANVSASMVFKVDFINDPNG